MAIGGMFQFLVMAWLVAAVSSEYPNHNQTMEFLQRECVNLTLHESRRPGPPDADVPMPIQAVFNKSLEKWLTKDNSSMTVAGFQYILNSSCENLILLDVFAKIAEQVTEASIHWGRAIMNMTTNHVNDTEMHQLDMTTAMPDPRVQGGRGKKEQPPTPTPPPEEMSVLRRAKHLRRLASYGTAFFYGEQQVEEGDPPPFEKFLDSLLQEQISEALRGPLAFGHEAGNKTNSEFQAYPTADTHEFIDLKANLTHGLEFVGRLMKIREKVQKWGFCLNTNTSPALFTNVCNNETVDRFTCKTCPVMSKEANTSLETLKTDLQVPLSILQHELQSVSSEIGERFRTFMAEKRRKVVVN